MYFHFSKKSFLLIYHLSGFLVSSHGDFCPSRSGQGCRSGCSLSDDADDFRVSEQDHRDGDDVLKVQFLKISEQCKSKELFFTFAKESFSFKSHTNRLMF